MVSTILPFSPDWHRTSGRSAYQALTKVGIVVVSVHSQAAGRRRRLGVDPPLTPFRFICRPPNHILSSNIPLQENPSTPSPDSLL